jgi:hypothetical protein
VVQWGPKLQQVFSGLATWKWELLDNR